MSESWKSLRQVPQDMLQERIETIKPLNDDSNELYEIVKDRETGDHYLHYAYKHLHVSDGSEETFHQLLPLESDDVLGLIFGEQQYRYPEHWTKAFLRNGPDGSYVWFDPSELQEEAGKQRKAEDMVDIMRTFKSTGQVDEESVKKMLEEIERKLSDGEK
jgi:hypothetical protein